MNTIIFNDFVIKPGRIDFTCIRNERKDNVYFEFSEPIIPRNDLIACALSTLSCKSYDSVHFDLDISKDMYDKLSRFIEGKFSARINNELTNNMPPSCEKKGIAISFSGGFDSLAVASLMPYAKLISIYFEGFDREKNFFDLYKPYALSTNFRRLGISSDDISWTFMGVGAILYSDFLNIKYHIFGTILEASEYNCLPTNDKQTIVPFTFIDILHPKPAAGLSEVGTAMIVSYYYPQLFNLSLQSLANENTEKLYRKYLLTKIVEQKYNRRINIIPCEPPNSPSIFGKYFTTDFLTFYFIKFFGLDIVEKYIINIPQSIKELVNNLSLNFYERLNTNYLKSIPEELRHDYLHRLSQADIIPYEQKDWYEFMEVMKALSTYYPILKKY